MSSLPSVLSARIEAVAGIDPELRPATKPQFGHFQSNVALRLAKSEGQPPREVATEIVARLEVADLCEPPEIAGPGFLNFRLTDAGAGRGGDRAAGRSRTRADSGRASPQIVVIDYSAPNVAKQMHVGHLRSTVIGDCLHRVLRGVGHRVIAAEPHRRLGHPVRHAGRADPRGGHRRPPPVARRGRGALHPGQRPLRVRRRLRRPGPAPGRRAAVRGRADPGDLAPADRRCRCAGFNAAYARLGRAAHRRRPGRGVDLQRRPARGGRRPGSGRHRGDRRRRAVRVRRGLQRADDRPQARRRLRLLGHRPGRDPAPGARVRTPTGSIYVVDARQSDHFDQVFAVARKAGFLPDERGDRARRVRHGAGHRRQAVQDPRRHRGHPEHPAGRGRGAGGPADRAGGDQVRRPVQRAEQGLRLRRRPDGADHRQHRPVPAVRPRPDGPGAAQGRGRRGRRAAERSRCSTSRPSRRWPCC